MVPPWDRLGTAKPAASFGDRESAATPDKPRRVHHRIVAPRVGIAETEDERRQLKRLQYAAPATRSRGAAGVDTAIAIRANASPSRANT